MPKIEWDSFLDRRYEQGIDHVVLYLSQTEAIAWNGVASINEKEKTSKVSSYYIDGVKIFDEVSDSPFSAMINAVTIPEIIYDIGGYLYAMSYRTKMQNGKYKLHLIYDICITPADIIYNTEDASPELSDFAFDLNTIPNPVDGYGNTSHIVVDPDAANPYLAPTIDTMLYGDDETNINLPTFSEFVDLFANWVSLKIIDHGDGSWTAKWMSSLPDEAIIMIDETSFKIDWPSAVYVDADTYTISSL